MKASKVVLSCGLKAGMSEATAGTWDPGLWMYPLMDVHEDTGGNVRPEDILEDEEGTFYFCAFDCGCAFYVPSTMVKGTFGDELPGDVELDEPGFSIN